MRAARFLLIGLFAVLALALLAAWQLPGRLDWNRYRGTIESLASATLGRPVTIAGPITLSLLPETELTAADVVVAGNAPGEEPAAPALTVKALRLRVAPLALLSGRVDARELALSGPDMAIGWPLRRGELAGWPPYWLGAFAARIENGRLRVGGLALDGIDATLETTEAGGLQAAGTGKLAGQPIRLTARLTASGIDGAAGLNLAVQALDRLAGMTGGFAGQLAADGTLVGRVDLSGPDLALLIAPAPAGASAAAAAGAFKVGSVVKATGDSAVFDDLTIDLAGPNGPTAFNGAATLRFAPGPRLDAKLATARLDLDPWVPRLARMGGSGLAIGLELKAEAVAFGGGLMRGLSAAMEVTEAQIALREVAVQLPGEADLHLNGVVQRGDPARPRFEGSMRLAAPRLREVLGWLDGAGLQLLPDLPDGVLASTEFHAHAVAEPGLLALDHLEGRLDDTAVNGELRLWPRLRAGTQNTAPGAPVHNSAPVAPTYNAAPGAPTYSAAPGAPTFNTAPGAPGNGPAIVASLELGSLQLDPWLPDGLPRGADLGRGFDMDLRLRTRLARLRGEEITGLSLDGAIQASGAGAQPQPAAGAVAGPSAGSARVTLRQLEATVRGVRVTASGTVAEGGRLTEGKLQANTDDASPLADLVPAAWRPAPGFWRGPAALSVQLAGPVDALGVKLTADMADARLEAQPVIDLRGGKWSGPVTLRHPGAPRLLGMLGAPGAEVWLGEGSLSVIAHMSGEKLPGEAGPMGTRIGLGRIVADMLDVTAGDLRLSAPLALDMGGEAPVLSGRVQADTLAVPAPAWRDTTPLPFGLLRGWRASVPVTARQLLVGRRPVLTQLAGTLSLADGTLRLDPFSAVLAGGAFSLTLAAADAEPPTLAVKFGLTDAKATGASGDLSSGGPPLDLLAGLVNGSADLTASGHSPAAMLATLAGGVTMNVTDGVLSGFDLFQVTRTAATADQRARAAAEAALRGAVTDGVTNFDRLTIRAEAQSGTLALQEGSLAGSAGSADFTGTVGVASRVMDLRVAMHPAIEAPPEVAVRLTGPWEKPRRSPELAGFLRWLGERRPATPGPATP